MDSVLRKINKNKKEIPLGISIGSTNQPYLKIEDMIEDIYKSFDKVLEEDYFDYFELNISCPNLINSENLKDKFDEPLGLGMLLNKLSYLNINKPLFIKMYLEKSAEYTLSLCEVANAYKFVNGFIFSNLVKDRTNPHFDKEEIEKAGKGNFSGKPTEKITNNLISAVYKKYKDRFVIIGCGGVFTGADAYEKIKRGATLIQMITGMIYEGPSVIGKINKDLAKLLKRDGCKNISEAVGSYYK
jgi:dihydroorotate dehydrogenase